MMSSSGEISCTGVDLHYDYHGSTTHLFFSLSPYLLTVGGVLTYSFLQTGPTPAHDPAGTRHLERAITHMAAPAERYDKVSHSQSRVCRGQTSVNKLVYQIKIKVVTLTAHTSSESQCVH